MIVKQTSLYFKGMGKTVSVKK